MIVFFRIPIIYCWQSNYNSWWSFFRRGSDEVHPRYCFHPLPASAPPHHLCVFSIRFTWVMNGITARCRHSATCSSECHPKALCLVRGITLCFGEFIIVFGYKANKETPSFGFWTSPTVKQFSGLHLSLVVDR